MQDNEFTTELSEVLGWFEEPMTADLKKYKVIAADYNQGGYDGDAFVLLKKGKEYFEVNGSHCSCHGLEGQWELEDTTMEALKYRIDNGHGYGSFEHCSNAIKEHFGKKWK